jgi:Transporter associated domain.
MDKLGKIPVVGDKITIGNFIIEVIETDGYRIKLLRLKRK